jgi:flavin-dependent dehydrogenase
MCLLLDVGLDEIWGTTDACLAVHRSDLHEVLRKAAGAPIRFGTTVESVHADDTGVRVRLSDGDTCEYMTSSWEPTVSTRPSAGWSSTGLRPVSSGR